MEWMYILLGFLGGMVFTALYFIGLIVKLAKQFGGK